MNCSLPGFPVLPYLLEFAQTQVHWVDDAIQLSHSLPLLLLLPSIFPSIRVFSTELALCIRWPNYWHFNFSINPCNEYLGLISFRIDWFDLLVLQGTLKSLLQDRSSKTSILQCSAPFMEPGTKTLPQVLIWVSPCTTHIHFLCSIRCMEGFLDGSVDKDSSCNAVDLGLISGLRRSGGGNGNPLVFLPGESMDRGAWRATVQRVAKSWIQLTKHTQVHWGRGQERGWG